MNDFQLYIAFNGNESLRKSRSCTFYKIRSAYILVYGENPGKPFVQATDEVLNLLKQDDKEWLQSSIRKKAKMYAKDHPEETAKRATKFMECFQQKLEEQKLKLSEKEEVADGSNSRSTE